MLKHTFIQEGFVKKLTLEQGKKSFIKLFDLNDWFKRTALYFGISVLDPCCDTDSVYANVRFNTETSQTEYTTDGVTWTNTAATPAPTTPVTDDTANTFDFTYATGYSSNSDYEQTLNSGSTYTALSAKPIAALTGVHAIGSVGVRVKSLGARPASATLYNAVAFS